MPPYPAGDAVRTLIDDGTVALASVADDANVGHEGQMTFVHGIKEAFAGHEPDATTPIGNTDRWVNQVGDGTVTSLWYHPNRLGQNAYAAVTLTGGDYGATPQHPEEPETPPPGGSRTIFKAKPVQRKVAAGQVVKVRTLVRHTDGSRPRGRVLLRVARTKDRGHGPGRRERPQRAAPARPASRQVPPQGGPRRGPEAAGRLRHRRRTPPLTIAERRGRALGRERLRPEGMRRTG